MPMLSMQRVTGVTWIANQLASGIVGTWQHAHRKTSHPQVRSLLQGQNKINIHAEDVLRGYVQGLGEDGVCSGVKGGWGVFRAGCMYS